MMPLAAAPLSTLTAGLVAVGLLVAILATALPRASHGIGAVGAVLLAALTALVAVLFAGEPEPVTRIGLGGWDAPLGVALHLDGLAVVMLGMTAVTSLAASLYAVGYVDDPAARRQFWPLWLWLWAALNLLFLSGDVFNLYVTLELVGLAAVALVALAGSPSAVTAAMRYLLVSLMGSMAYLMGVALLYGQYGVLDLVELAGLVAADPSIPRATLLAAALMTAGLMFKAALLPLHMWLAPAHGAAPAPVSAVLSALVVAASFYLILRLWLGVFAPLRVPGIGVALGVLGVAALVWGSLQALQAARLKRIVAYSTVAQLGYLLLAFPLMAITPGAWKGVVFLAVAHALAKGAVFLAAGTLQRAAGHDRLADLGPVLRARGRTAFAMGLAGMSLVGLPPTGGFVAKYLLLDAALPGVVGGTGGMALAVFWVAAILGGGLLSGAYVLRMVAPAFHRGARDPGQAVSAWMVWMPMLLALASVLLGLVGVPIMLMLGHTTGGS